MRDIPVRGGGHNPLNVKQQLQLQRSHGPLGHIICGDESPVVEEEIVNTTTTASASSWLLIGSPRWIFGLIAIVLFAIVNVKVESGYNALINLSATPTLVVMHMQKHASAGSSGGGEARDDTNHAQPDAAEISAAAAAAAVAPPPAKLSNVEFQDRIYVPHDGRPFKPVSMEKILQRR